MARKGIRLADAMSPQGVRLYAVGDVHGRLDLLSDMHRTIQAEMERDRPAGWRVIHLGDYVDRGEDSSGVIDFLIGATGRDDRHIALAGNHDLAFLDFLARPEPDGLFVNFGGEATARSYGVELRTDTFAALSQSQQALAAAVPDAHRRFLESLRFSVSFGDYFFCHAGVRPGVALDKQSADDLAWIRQDFLRHPKPFDKMVVHGHTPTERVALLENRINVDTGAYFSGRLSAVVLDGAEKRVIEVIGPEDERV